MKLTLYFFIDKFTKYYQSIDRIINMSHAGQKKIIRGNAEGCFNEGD